ncbi:MAG: acyl-CoA dehydrogenase family protein [Planctomycetota bacterium]|jgi:acyl-CoA dehydrogenase
MTELPEQVGRLKAEAREFIDTHVIPRIGEIDEKCALPDELVEELKRGQYFGIVVPEEYGGLGLGILGVVAVMEELSRGHSALPSLLNGNLNLGSKGLLLAGTPAQREKYLHKIATGECRTSFALTEPEAGSDAASIRTTAVRDGDDFVINGMKHFITGADVADLFTVFAMTDPEKGSKGGVTAFLVERDAPGLRVGKVQPGMAGGPIVQCEVHFEDCRVPAGQVLGEVGWGFAVAMQTLDDGRLIIGSYSLGSAKRAMELSVDWAKQRVQFGKPIAENQLIQGYLAQMATKIEALECMVYDVAQRRDRGGVPLPRECAMVKLFAAEVGSYVTDRAVQIFGGRGWMRGWEVERLYRGARLTSLIEGSSEILQIVIARDVLRKASAA